MSDKVDSFDDLRSLLLKELATAPAPVVIDRALTDAVREFFSETKVWREWLAPIASVDYQQDYTLPNPFEASIHSIKSLKVDGNVFKPEDYMLHDETFVRFNNGKEPVSLTNRVLQCANTATTLLATWQAIADGCFTIDLDGTYAITGLSFVGATSFDSIARTIQTAVRQAITSARVSVTWDGTAFTFSVTDGSIGYLSAKTGGTDLSVGAWLAGVTGTATLGGLIEAEVVLRPDYNTTEVPSWLLDRWSLGIVHLAAFRLKTESKKPWSDVTTAAINQNTYQGQKLLAVRSTIGGLNDKAFSMSA